MHVGQPSSSTLSRSFPYGMASSGFNGPQHEGALPAHQSAHLLSHSSNQAGRQSGSKSFQFVASGGCFSPSIEKSDANQVGESWCRLWHFVYCPSEMPVKATTGGGQTAATQAPYHPTPPQQRPNIPRPNPQCLPAPLPLAPPCSPAHCPSPGGLF